MNTLDELAIKHNTDKSSKHHDYANIYDSYFHNYRNTFKKVLEIGVFRGGSLNMWQDYFNSAEIYGLDINKKCKKFEHDRIKMFIGSQIDDNILLTIGSGNEYDLIIDDGSHIVEHQIYSFTKLLPYVKKGGYYIIEDINTSYWKKFNGGLKRQGTSIEFFKDRVDDINFNGYHGTGHEGKLNTANRNFILKQKPDLNDFEKYIKSIHFYSGLSIIIRG